MEDRHRVEGRRECWCSTEEDMVGSKAMLSKDAPGIREEEGADDGDGG